jgi:hypothetical protein
MPVEGPRHQFLAHAALAGGQDGDIPDGDVPEAAGTGAGDLHPVPGVATDMRVSSDGRGARASRSAIPFSY